MGAGRPDSRARYAGRVRLCEAAFLLGYGAGGARTGRRRFRFAAGDRGACYARGQDEDRTTIGTYIVRRKSKTRGIRWHVRFEQGRNAPIVHLGVFGSEREARLRKRAADELAARGRVPYRELVEPRAEVVVAESVAQAADAWLASRVDLSDSSRRNYASAIRRFPASWVDPHAVTYRDVQAWLLELAETLKPGSANICIVALRQVFDFADVTPNPAADRRLRKPRGQRKVYRLPTVRQIAAIRAELPEKHRGILDLLEHGGLRISEAVGLRWRDVHDGRILVVSSKTASGRRWVSLERPPVRRGENPDDRVFAAVPSAEAFRDALSLACERAGVPHYSPHDFRHLHASRLLHAGMSPAELAARLGHAHPGVTLSTYAHVVPPD